MLPQTDPMTAFTVRPCVAVAAALVLAGCSIPPRPDTPDLRQEAPLAGLAVPRGGAWPQAEWWQRYRDPQLDALERKALATAPSLEEAHQRFEGAIRSIDVARAVGGASTEFNGQVQRQRLSEHGLIPSQFLGFTWYDQGDLSLQFRYDFDFWGKQRAAVEAAVDAAHAAEAERSAAALLLASAVADTYFGWQADQARLALAGDAAVALERSRGITARRVTRGIEAPDALQQAAARVAAARELEAAYAGSAPIRLAALAALLGSAPQDLPTLAAMPLPEAGAALPDDVGIDLLARRPDIAASRWRVEAAMRRVDQARAEFYPDISLGAMAGLSSIDLDRLLTAGSRVAGIGPALHLPLFNLGGLRAAYGVSQAQLQAAAAAYDSSVVDAARDVASQALALQQIQARERERARQLDTARVLQGTAAARVQRGIVDARDLYAAQAQLLQQRDAQATLQAQAVSTEIALIKALGGGYHAADTAAVPAAGARSSGRTAPATAVPPAH